ncbi:hypothetical protein Acsp04_39340 [Actinomadura sp. NBRC 104425]|nr:hypothetical protein Acsp04_39340 [Actinomadura sp. NBRC 104425]
MHPPRHLPRIGDTHRLKRKPQPVRRPIGIHAYARRTKRSEIHQCRRPASDSGLKAACPTAPDRVDEVGALAEPRRAGAVALPDPPGVPNQARAARAALQWQLNRTGRP